MRHAPFIATFLIISTLGSGCAFGIYGLATNGKNQNVVIETNPPDAKIKVEGMVQQSPAQFNLPRENDYVAFIEKPGYETTRVYINKTVNPLVFFVDGFWSYLFKTAWDLNPPRIYVDLREKK